MNDKIKGLIYGSIIGDAVGAGHNRKKYGGEYKIKFEEIDITSDWTSVSERLILIMEVLESSNKNNFGHINVFLAAKKLCEWQEMGLSELSTKNNNISMNLNFILKQKDYLINPIKSSKQSYIKTGSDSAFNDAISSISIFGAYNNWYKNTILYTIITTFDSRCIVACLIHSFIINCIITNKVINWSYINPICHKIIVSQKIEKRHNLIEYNNYLNIALNYKCFINNFYKGKPANESAFLQFLKKLNIGNYEENENQSYVLLGMVISMITAMDIQYLLSKKESITTEYFKRRIQETASCGGDATTNCSIVGSIIGAFLGFKKLPEDWIKKIGNKSWLDLKIDAIK